jgi:hypothetical protein
MVLNLPQLDLIPHDNSGHDRHFSGYQAVIYGYGITLLMWLVGCKSASSERKVLLTTSSIDHIS